VAAALTAMGCAGAQGRFFSGPLDAARATEWLGSHPFAAPREVAPVAPLPAPKVRRPLARRSRSSLPAGAGQARPAGTPVPPASAAAGSAGVSG
jgi:hypothetical protein